MTPEALRATGDEPTYQDTLVVAVDDQLMLVRPGVAGAAGVFADVPGNDAATDLGLIAPPAARADAVSPSGLVIFIFVSLLSLKPGQVLEGVFESPSRAPQAPGTYGEGRS